MKFLVLSFEFSDALRRQICISLKTKNKKLKTGQGFTLIELLVYTGILILIVAVVGGTILALGRTYHSITSEERVDQAGAVSMERILRETRDANSVDTVNSTFTTPPGILTLNTTDNFGAAETMRLSAIGGSVHLLINGADQGPLAPTSTSITNLVFRYATTSHSQAIKIEMTFTSGTSTWYRSKNFYGTAVLRGSYVTQ